MFTGLLIWCDPPKKSTYETLNDIPEPLRHHAEKIEAPKYVGPDSARILGWADIFYPEELKAGRYDMKCIAESCGLFEYHTCPFNVKATYIE